MLIYLYIKTKNHVCLKNISKTILLLLFKNYIKNIKYLPLPNKKTLFSLLKSPHVNKAAQDQFEFKYFKRKLIIFSFSSLKTLLIFKKSYSNLFHGLKIKILLIISSDIKLKSYCLKKCKLKRYDILGEKIVK